jgi:hypothetical protein
MERAAGDVVRTSTLQTYVTIDDIDDVGPLQQFLNERLRNHAEGTDTRSPERNIDAKIGAGGT